MRESMALGHINSNCLPQMRPLMPPQANHFQLNNGKQRALGSLKFFYEGDMYGFLVSDLDGRDVFFHFDDMKIATHVFRSYQPFTVEYLSQMARDPYVSLRFSYEKLAYFGRYGLSMKAVNIEFLGIVQKQLENWSESYSKTMAQELLSGDGSYSRFESAVPPYSN